MQKWSSVLVMIAGLLGAAGIAAGAAAAHKTGGGSLETAGIYLLVHAAAITGISLNSGKNCYFLACASLLAGGVTLFGADIALRALAGVKLFAMAAPAGGIMLILGWGLLAIAAFAELVGSARQG